MAHLIWPNRRRSATALGLQQIQPPSRLQRVARVLWAYIITVTVCGYMDRGAFNTFELALKDKRWGLYEGFNGNLQDRAKREIALVAMTDDTFNGTDTFPGIPGPPATRDHHAKIIRELHRAGARMVVFDLYFDESRPQDVEFADAAHDFGRVVWGARPNDPEPGLLLTNEQLYQASPHRGHLGAVLDERHPVVDHIQTVLRDGDLRVPALSLEAALLAWGIPESQLHRVPGGWRAGAHFIPVDDLGNFPISFLKPPNESKFSDVFPTVPYEFVLHDKLRDPFYQHLIHNKIVFIGDCTQFDKDEKSTPVGEMWGVEVHAHALATILFNAFILPVAPWVNFASVAVLAAFVCFMASALSLRRATVRITALLLCYPLFNIYLFVERGYWLHLFAPMVAMGMAALSTLLVRNALEQVNRRRTHTLLQRNLSQNLADYVIEHPESCILGGERVTATVLFSDIRGFTDMSERMEPEEVVERLNEYLQAMTHKVFEQGGTLDKYIGDAIMAIYGAPQPYTDHAHRAVATAIGMEEELLKLQARWQAAGLATIDIGIGINTGDMVVGNIGSEERNNYTVIGDAVNLASRVEGLNKPLHSRILVTESTYRSVQHEVSACGPVMVKVKGKAEAVAVYQILGWDRGGICRPRTIDPYDTALRAVLDPEWLLEQSLSQQPEPAQPVPAVEAGSEAKPVVESAGVR